MLHHLQLFLHLGQLLLRLQQLCCVGLTRAHLQSLHLCLEHGDGLALLLALQRLALECDCRGERCKVGIPPLEQVQDLEDRQRNVRTAQHDILQGELERRSVGARLQGDAARHFLQHHVDLGAPRLCLLERFGVALHQQVGQQLRDAAVHQRLRQLDDDAGRRRPEHVRG